MDIERLIDLVKQHEELYNMNHIKYTDKLIKEKVWIEIANEMNETATSCKKAWINLRDSFRRAHRKHESFKSGKISNKIKPWKYENEMHFLLHYGVEKKIHNLTRKFIEKSKSNDLINKDAEIKMPSSKKTSPTKKTKVENLDSEETASSVLMKYLDERKMPSKDPLAIFFSSVCSTVRTFSPYNQIIAKSKIFDIISQLEIEQIKETTPSYDYNRASPNPYLKSASSSSSIE